MKTRKIIHPSLRPSFHKPFIAALVALVLIACMSVPVSAGDSRNAGPAQPEPAPAAAIDALMAKWLESVHDWNPDAYAACYWPDARYTVIRTVGQVERFLDREAMLDPDGKGYLNIHNANVLRWASAGQLFHAPGSVQDTQYALKDFDGDGQLRHHEREGIAYRLFEVMKTGISVIVSPMGKAFDANDDGLLDKAEAANIRSTLFPTWVDGKEWNAGAAIPAVDAWLAGL